jgi:hypothetical protein
MCLLLELKHVLCGCFHQIVYMMVWQIYLVYWNDAIYMFDSLEYESFIARNSAGKMLFVFDFAMDHVVSIRSGQKNCFLQGR